MISLCFLGLYQQADSWLSMICANSARRLLRTPWLTCLRTMMVNMVCWLNPKLISQIRSSTSQPDSKNATCIYYAVLVVLEGIRAGLVYHLVYHPRKGGESGAGSVQSQTSHIPHILDHKARNSGQAGLAKLITLGSFFQAVILVSSE